MSELRSLKLRTMQRPEPHVIYEMNECHSDFFTTEKEWNLVEKSAYDQLENEHIELINDALKKLEAKDIEISRLRFELSKLRANA